MTYIQESKNTFMNPVDKELIEEKLKNVRSEIKNNHTEVKLLLEKILEQATRTNGRVTVLETETRFVRNLTRYPKLAWFAFFGLLVSIYIKDILIFLKTII